MLERLVYTSTAAHALGSLHLFNLLVEARIKNKKLGITGHLLYLDGRFTQCIEGPQPAIEGLWQSLCADDRHHSIRLIQKHPTAERRFSEWSMAFSSYSSFDQFNMPGFFPVNERGVSIHSQACSEWVG